MDLQCPSFQVLFTFLLRTVILLLKIGKRGYNNNSSALKLPPGPWKLPIIGNIHQLIGALPHRVLRDLAKQHGHLMHLKLGEVSTVVVSSAKFAKEVIKTHDIIFASRPQVIATRIVFCDSEDIAFAPYGEYWRELRKICTQELLSAKRVQSYRRPIREKEGSGLKRVELWGGSSNDADIRGFGLFDKVRLIEQSNAKHLPITRQDGFWRRRVEMFSLPNEIGSRFCLLGDITTGPDYSLFVVDKVIERYYPTLKMGQTLASLEVKSGYGTYVLDFHISKSTSYSPHEKIRLFIAQTDNIEISFCIISPQQVNFLLNGKGVGYWITIAYKCDWIA